MSLVLYLDKTKLESILSIRGLSINKLADACGISRQSIYNMFDDTPVFNTSFDKIRRYLNVDYRVITADRSVAYEVLKFAPDRIKLASYQLYEFAKEHKADLLLISSNDAGKFGQLSEWIFGLFFPKKDHNEELMVIRQKLNDIVAPYTIDMINFNRAPLWLKWSVKDKYLRLLGSTPEDEIFASRD